MGKKKGNKKKYIKKIIQWLIYLAVGYFVFQKLNGQISDLWGFDFARPWWLLIAIAFYTLHSFWNALNWHRIMELSGEDLPLIGQMDVYLRSYLLRYIPGNVVGILARGYFNQPNGVKMAKSLWGWFFENVVYLVVGSVIGSYLLFVLDIDLIYATAAVIFIILGALFGIFKLEWLEIIFEKLLMPRLPKEEQVKDHTLNLGVQARGTMVLRYFFSWTITSIAYLMVAYAITDLTGTDIPVLVAIYAAAWSVGYASFITPSGGGVREAVMLELLSLYNGFDVTIAVVIMIASRVVFIIGELLAIAVFYLVVLYNKSIDNHFSLTVNGKEN